MELQEGYFYRDQGGDVWQAINDVVLLFVADNTGCPDIITNDFVPAEQVERDYGPLVEVRPTGWEVVQ
ncbi:hypothetical protein J3S85_37715 [Streptomyces lavenduligriseus]|nr:hypothetical protein J3S85_37715 [Streptomyces lavenduligriseus]